MQIREYDGIDEKQLNQSLFTRWFCCMNKACKTTLVMPQRYRVVVD
jgi:truncated hemoglobin YjbI